jgi:tryptophan synthase alpha chain
MDGPVIQAASHRALKAGMSLAKALNIAAAFTASRNVPLIFMGSVNPLLAMGAEAFVARAQAVGVGACILPDLPLEDQFRIAGIPQVQLVAPNTPELRVKQLLDQDPPFLYCVTVFGVTGARTTTAEYTLPFLRRMKNLSQTPVLAGFGVSTPPQAVELASVCDGVIIGSALIRALSAAEPKDQPQAAKDFLEPFRQALDGV